MTPFQYLLLGIALIFIPFGIFAAMKAANAAVSLVSKKTGAPGATPGAPAATPTPFLSFLPSWAIVPLCILAAIAAFALLQHSPQLLFIGLGVVVAGYALKVLSTKPPSSWTTIALVAIVLLFLGWSPTWRYVENAVSWYENTTPAQTLQPLQTVLLPTIRIPNCSDGWSNDIQVPTGYSVTWSWTVQAQYSFDGSNFLDHIPMTYPDADTFHFCSTKQNHIAKDMPLTWGKI